MIYEPLLILLNSAQVHVMTKTNGNTVRWIMDVCSLFIGHFLVMVVILF